MRVLIVDDSKVAGRHLAEMLSEFPEIELLGQVADGNEAVDRIRQQEPDVVILEVNLPSHDGFEVLKRVKQENAASIVMVLTGYPFLQYQERCGESGADFFFDKSIGFSVVRQTFKQLIERGSGTVH